MGVAGVKQLTGLPTDQQAQALDHKQLLRELSEDRALASRVIFGHRHSEETPPFHIEMVDLWRSSDEFLAIEAFRGAAKTTLSEEFLLLEALFGNFSYCLLFGETYTKACMRIEAIKHEITHNHKISELFGPLKCKPWNESQVGLPNGALLEAHGWEEEIRGYKHLNARPDRAHLDDIETLSSVRDTAAVDAGWRKLNQQLIPAMDKNKRKIRITGTPLADDCILHRCASTAEWVVAKFPIVTARGAEGDAAIEHPTARATWPQRYPLTWVRTERERMANSGLLREFVQEFQLIAAQTQGKPFTEEEIRYEDIGPLTYAPKIYICDPARTATVGKSDRTGRVVVSRVGTRFYVYESSGEYWKPDAIVNDCFDTSQRHDDCEIAIERNSLDEWLMQPLRAEMVRRGFSLELTPILAPGDRSKEQFILGLQPYFKVGDIVLVGGKSKHQQLVQEILNFPAGKRDILNALAYVQRVFGGEPVYGEFGQDNIVSGHVPDRQSQLLLGMHATTSEICAVLIEVEGKHMTVLAAFQSTLGAEDAVSDITRLVVAAYPAQAVKVWVPADDYDQQGRVALVDSLRRARINVFRGGYITQSRGCLADMLRTQMAGRRLLRVASTANPALRALAGGYKRPLGKDGRPVGEPERNVARTLMEALETTVYAVQAGTLAAELPDGFGRTRNVHGVGYLSTVRR